MPATSNSSSSSSSSMAKHLMITIIMPMVMLIIIMMRVSVLGAEASPAYNKHKSESRTEPKKRIIPHSSSPPSFQNRTANINGTWASATEVAEFLAGQNAARAAVNVVPLLRWDTRLEQYAMWWARQRRLDCALRHSMGPFGENIFWGSANYNWRPSDAVTAWTAERAFYDPYSNSCDPGHMCGHYTQIVWRSTSAVGCARVVCLNRQIFIICSYAPPGNYVGERPY